MSVTTSVVVLWSLTMAISRFEDISFSLYTILMDLEQLHNYWLELHPGRLGRNIDLLVSAGDCCSPCYWQETCSWVFTTFLKEKEKRRIVGHLWKTKLILHRAGQTRCWQPGSPNSGVERAPRLGGPQRGRAPGGTGASPGRGGGWVEEISGQEGWMQSRGRRDGISAQEGWMQSPGRSQPEAPRRANPLGSSEMAPWRS